MERKKKTQKPKKLKTTFCLTVKAVALEALSREL